MWNSCCVKQTICSLSVKNYSKVNIIIFSSVLIWLHLLILSNLLMSVLLLSDVLWGLCSVCSACIQRVSVHLLGCFSSISLYSTCYMVALCSFESLINILMLLIFKYDKAILWYICVNIFFRENNFYTYSTVALYEFHKTSWSVFPQCKQLK